MGFEFLERQRFRVFIVPRVTQMKLSLSVNLRDLVGMIVNEILREIRLTFIQLSSSDQYRLVLGELPRDLVMESPVRATALVVVSARKSYRLGGTSSELREQFGALARVSALIQPHIACRRIPGMTWTFQSSVARAWRRALQVWSAPAIAFSSTGAQATPAEVVRAKEGVLGS